ncbi:DNA cytosine methyltransferase, partial [Acinetobacter baumannii]|uniref:DNA cytosine methyltransferase n=1 Tax=Acinetobacter baumannii TaxID=470 RepID=UPI003329F58A
MRERPAVVVLENVAGLLSVGFEEIHSELRKLGYRSGAICVNDSYFLPQSRPRVFIIGVQDQVEIPSSIVDDGPNWLH